MSSERRARSKTTEKIRAASPGVTKSFKLGADKKKSKTTKGNDQKPFDFEQNNDEIKSNNINDNDKNNDKDNNNNDDNKNNSNNNDDGSIVELKDPVNDRTKLKEIFDTFKNGLDDQEKLLLKKWDQDTNTTLLIDFKNILLIISNIGLLKGKLFEELENEQDAAINKLKEILTFEETSRLKHLEALELQKKVDEEMRLITEQSNLVEKQLANAKPAIEEAKIAVSKIEKNHLDELRALKKPPNIVVMVMTAALEMVRINDNGNNNELKPLNISNWRENCKLITSKFINNILEFDTMKLSQNICNQIEKEYILHEEFNYERANKASRVAGPLVLWIKSQISYAKLLNSIKPMIDKIDELKNQLKHRESEFNKLKLLEKDLKNKIKISRSEMLEMVGYRKIGNLYFK